MPSCSMKSGSKILSVCSGAVSMLEGAGWAGLSSSQLPGHVMSGLYSPLFKGTVRVFRGAASSFKGSGLPLVTHLSLTFFV